MTGPGLRLRNFDDIWWSHSFVWWSLWGSYDSVVIAFVVPYFNTRFDYICTLLLERCGTLTLCVAAYHIVRISHLRKHRRRGKDIACTRCGVYIEYRSHLIMVISDEWWYFCRLGKMCARSQVDQAEYLMRLNIHKSLAHPYIGAYNNCGRGGQATVI